MFDALNKRCELGDLTNYISNASNLQERVASNTYSKSFKISEENVIRAFPLMTMFWESDRIRLCGKFYRQKPAKESVKGEPPYVLWINVQSLNFLQAANLSHISVTFQLVQRCGQFG